MNRRLRYTYLCSVVWLVVFVSGCATITSTETQPVTVTTRASDGQPLDKAACALSNESGNWEITTPGVVSVKRSAKDLMVECKKEGHSDGHARAISRAAGSMWGNIIFGGGVGAIIDHNKGTGYNYPDNLVVKMGAAVTIDRRDQDSHVGEEKTNADMPLANQPSNEDNKPAGPSQTDVNK